jgi:hypothetical protein
MLRTGDTCARVCEGTAYRIGERQQKLRAEKAEAEIARLNAERATFYMDYRMKCDADIKDLHAEVERLKREVETLRHYGNKDCTAMADAALKEQP